MYDKKFHNLNFASLSGVDYDCSVNLGRYSYKFDKEAYIRIGRSVKKIGIQKCIELEIYKIDYELLLFHVNNNLNLVEEEDISNSNFKNITDTLTSFKENVQFIYKERCLVASYFGKDFFSKKDLEKSINYISNYTENSIAKQFKKKHQENLNNRIIPTTKNKSLISSCVYIIGSSENNRYKIGVSKHPKRRIPQLQIATSFRLNIVYETSVFCGAYDVEEKIHQEYKDFGLTNEWFLLTEKQINEIINKLQSIKN